MKIILSTLLVLGCALAQAAPIVMRDDAGHEVRLAQPARRVIALAPSLTEMVFKAGGGDRLVGTVEYSNFPPAALQVPRIGSNQKLDLERIAALKPDLVLVWYHGNGAREVERLGALGIPMFRVEPRDIAGVADALERLGRLLGTEATAARAANDFRARYAQLRQQYAGRTPLRVFYQISERPLLTINDQQIISAVMRECGGVNVFGKESALVPQLSTESVVAANPQVILTAKMGGGGNAPEPAMDAPELAGWLRFTSVEAVQRKQLWRIPGDSISRHGPRILDGMQYVCEALDQARAAR